MKVDTATQSGRGMPADRSPVGAPHLVITAIVLLLVYQGYTLSIAGIASPWIARSFHLDPSALARLFAWMAISSFGSMALARLADRIGRRRIIIASLVLSPLFALASALAPKAWQFAVFQILLSALLGGSVSSATVMLAEELPVEKRARGQAFGAGASAVGGMLGYIVIPFLLKWGYRWEWLLAPSVAGIGLVAPVARMLPPETRFTLVRNAGPMVSSRFYDVFHPLYRRRALTLIACSGLSTLAGTAVNGWLYFEAVSILGLSPSKASTLVVLGMGVAMLGFPVGAWASEKFGRVPSMAWFGGAGWLGALAFYWEPAWVAYPFLWLAVAYCWFRVATNVLTVASNAAATELFPATLRTTMAGWQMVAGAIFTIIAQAGISALIGPLGGLTVVIRYFAMLGLPCTVIYLLFLDETRGLPLDVASLEPQWAALHGRKYEPPPEGPDRQPDGAAAAIGGPR